LRLFSGAEVAQYTAAHFPKFLKESVAYKKGQYAQALEEAFIDFDKLLTTEAVIEQLKELAGIENHPPNESDNGNFTVYLCHHLL
jgi:protein phosphatase 1G